MITQTGSSAKVTKPLRDVRKPVEIVQPGMRCWPAPKMALHEGEPSAEAAYGCVEWFDYERHRLNTSSGAGEKA